MSPTLTPRPSIDRFLLVPCASQLQRFAAERRQLELERQLFADRERLHRQIEVSDPFLPTVRTHHDLSLPPLPNPRPTAYLLVLPTC